MTEAPLTVASAVILPEAEEVLTPSLKRRQSSVSENDDFKRRRVSHDEGSLNQEPAIPASAGAEARNGRLEGGQAAEERKRGRRLFGALLGTLSQSSSSSTAQKRRSDIEKKQQAKLKRQTEEVDERKKEKLEALTKARRREQRIYDRQSMEIRHSNLLAQGHFLRTKAEPNIYYKPWKLSSKDEDTIQSQVIKAKQTIEKESAQWEVDDPPFKEESPVDHPEKAVEIGEEVKLETVGDGTNKPEPPGPDTPLTTNDHGHPTTKQLEKSEASEAADHHGAEGEEMVEGEEDTVIY